jgi:hypothetical protein
VLLSRVSSDFWALTVPRALPPWVPSLLVKPGKLAREAIRENSLPPWRAPCVPPCPLAVVIVIVFVTFGECPGNVHRADNHDTVRFAGCDSAGREGLGEVLE